MKTLVQCEEVGLCEMCDEYTPWRLSEEDIHLCSNECYLEAEDLGLLAVAMKRVKAITANNVS